MTTIRVEIPSRLGAVGGPAPINGSIRPVNVDVAASIKDNPNFAKAKEELSGRLRRICHKIDEPEERKKVYATIFVNGLHAALPAIGIKDKDGKQAAMDKALSFMQTVRVDKPEDRYSNLDTKISDAAELLLANKSLAMEVISQFISRMLEEQVAGDKLIAYRDVRSAVSRETDSVFKEFLVTAESLQPTVALRT